MLYHSHIAIALSRFSDVALKCFEKFFDAHCFGYSRLLIRKRVKSTYAVGSTLEPLADGSIRNWLLECYSVFGSAGS
jgi:hypothetical protein